MADKQSLLFLVLAAGDATRWSYSWHQQNKQPPAEYKQLAQLPDLGHSVLARTLVQVNRLRDPEVDPVPRVVTHVPAIAQVGRDNGALPLAPAHRERLCQTIRSTAQLWGTVDRVVLLLGDVVWRTPESLRAVAECEAPVCFFGTLWELFAMTFVSNPEMNERILKVTRAADFPGKGKLWHMLRHMTGVPMENHRPREHGTLLTFVEDGTDDIDAWGDYQELSRVHRRRD